MRAYILFALVACLLTPAVSNATVKFMVLGDTQIARRCDDGLQDPWTPFEGISVADCRDYQGWILDGLLTYAEDIGVNFVWFMGDQIDGPTSTNQYQVMRDTIALHPNLTYHWMPGNHDVGAGTCLYVQRYVLNAFANATPVRRPFWEAWQVDTGAGTTVHFMSLSSFFWDGYLAACHEDQAGFDDTCRNYAAEAGAACSSNGASDGNAYGDTPCESDEMCHDIDGYALDQLAAVTAAVAAKEADPNAVAMIFGSHMTPWPFDNANVVTMDDVNNAFHNARTCVGGTNPDEYCDDYLQSCAGGGTCTNDVPGRNYRTLFEAAVAGLSTDPTFFSGHTHDDLDWSGTTQGGVGVTYDSSSITGSAAPASDADPITSMIVEINTDGTVTKTRIPATWQGVELHGVTLFGPSW
jgi:hypothetical protein